MRCARAAAGPSCALCAGMADDPHWPHEMMKRGKTVLTSLHNTQHNTQMNTKEIASQFVTSINSMMTGANNAAVILRALLDSVEQDIAKAAAAIAAEWEVGGFDRSPTRYIVSACYEADMSKEETNSLINALRKKGKVETSRQRQSQLTAVVFDGDKSKNKGKPSGKKAADVKTPLTVADIIKSIKALPSLTAADASALATAIKAKLA